MTNEVSNQNKLLFMGDYVDRGNFGVEILIFLMALKICYPQSVFILRGNHETRQMTAHYGFRDEVLSKFD